MKGDLEEDVEDDDLSVRQDVAVSTQEADVVLKEGFSSVRGVAAVSTEEVDVVFEETQLFTWLSFSQ